MLDFDLVPVNTPVRPAVTSVERGPVITETVTVTPIRSERSAFVGKPDAEWGWEDLRDYVIRAIEDRHGPMVRDFKKESGIFKAFLSRWPDGQAVAIARFAFESQNGMWRSAPISVNRFCKASDPYFAQEIIKRLG